MATEAITPAISEPVSTPAAAPSSSEPSSSPSVSEGKPESQLSGPETLGYLRNALAEVPKDQFEAAQRGEEAKPPVAKPATEVVKPAAEAPKPAAEAAKPGEEAKPGEAPKPAAAIENPLDKIGPVPAEKIAKAFQDDPELEAKLAPLGIGQNELVGLARDAALSTQYREHFATPEMAAYAKDSAGHFYDIEDSFTKLNNLEDLDGFIMNTMLPLSTLRDPQSGEPLKNADGTFQTDGSVQKFLGLAGDAELGFIRMAMEDLAKNGQTEEDKEYGQQLLAAVDSLNEFRSAGYKRPTGQGNDQVPAHVQAEMDRLRKESEQSKLRDADTRAAQTKITEDTVFNDTLKGIEPLVGEILNRTALSEPLKKKATNEIFAEMRDRLSTDKSFLRLKSDYWSRGGADMSKKLAALNITSMQGILSPVAEKILGEYGVDLVAANAARHTKIDRQIANDRSTPTSQTTSAAAAPKAITAEDIDKQAEEAVLARHGGRRTPQFQQEFLSEVFRLTQATGAAV